MSNIDLEYPWTEEFRPSKIEEVIGNEHLINKLNEYLSSKSIPNLLLVGHAGTGKTTIAKILADTICGKKQYLSINASERNNIETIRSDVIQYCSTSGFGTEIKIILLDEFDGMTIQAQRSLKAIMEDYAKTTRFILTANTENKIIDPIQSRCQKYEFFSASKNSIIKKCFEILKSKKIKIKNSKEEVVDAVKSIVNKCYPDIRLTINNLQKNCVNGEFVYDKTSINNKDTLIKYIKESDIKSIREEILNTTVDYLELYNFIYLNIKDITQNPEHGAGVILMISEYLYRHSTHLNSEMNFTACLIEIRNILKS